MKYGWICEKIKLKKARSPTLNQIPCAASEYTFITWKNSQNELLIWIQSYAWKYQESLCNS